MTGKQPSTEQSKRRRRSHGSAWHWKQTDGWYYTPPGTKRRVALRDSVGSRIKGPSNRAAADLALARLQSQKLWKPSSDPVSQVNEPLLVAQLCSEFLQHCEAKHRAGNLVAEYLEETRRTLNDWSSYCGALVASEVQKGHVEHWLNAHLSWKSPVTRRNVITIVLAAMNFAAAQHGIRNPIRGFKKPDHRPRLQSFSPEDEKAIYSATDKPFRDFLFAAIHTGLRPFCELAQLRIRDVIIEKQGMLWRVSSSKTKKVRRVPVRAEVATIVRHRLKSAGPDAPVFTNPQCRPWKRVTGRARFSQIRKTLGWQIDPIRRQFTCYTCRHTFAHRLLSGFWNGGHGCTIETLAELMGNTPQVAFAHYGREWGMRYQDPLWTAIGVDW